jgi:hypothetical protein
LVSQTHIYNIVNFIPVIKGITTKSLNRNIRYQLVSEIHSVTTGSFDKKRDPLKCKQHRLGTYRHFPKGKQNSQKKTDNQNGALLGGKAARTFW